MQFVSEKQGVGNGEGNFSHGRLKYISPGLNLESRRRGITTNSITIATVADNPKIFPSFF